VTEIPGRNIGASISNRGISRLLELDELTPLRRNAT
jgi:hypothetical protein